MAQTPPIIHDGILTYQQDGHPAQVVVDSPGWFAWLQNASTFTFCSQYGNFTVHKERAGNQRGRLYWRAYQTRNGKLHRALYWLSGTSVQKKTVLYSPSFVFWGLFSNGWTK